MNGTMTFQSMNLKENLLKGIFALGFEHPSYIQQQGIVMVASGRDVLAQAQSGTGKTATFAIGSLQAMNEEEPTTQIVVLEPTRELASQTWRVFRDLAQFLQVRVDLCVGGTRLNKIRRQNPPHVLIGTPGRMSHLARDGYIDLSRVQCLCIDEADEMLRQGFRDAVRTIINFVAETSSVCLFSATMSEETLELSRKFLHDPVRILVKTDEVTLSGIDQYYVNVERETNKLACLLDILKGVTQRVIVFVRSRAKVDAIIESMQDALDSDVVTVASTHSGLDMSERQRRLNDFRVGKISILVTTDLLARGIDVQQIHVVINYDLPLHQEDYIHRIGRSGRYGRKGLAITLVTNPTVLDINNLCIFYETEIRPLPSDVQKLLC